MPCKEVWVGQGVEDNPEDNSNVGNSVVLVKEPQPPPCRDEPEAIIIAMGVIESLELKKCERVTEFVATVGRLGPVSGFLLTSQRLIFPRAINGSFKTYSNLPDIRDLLGLKDILSCFGGLRTEQTRSLLELPVDMGKKTSGC
jgi:hypothetical protein